MGDKEGAGERVDGENKQRLAKELRKSFRQGAGKSVGKLGEAS